MGLIFPDPPTPPNPILTAGAQTASNIGTAITSNYLNSVNQITPSGNLTYDINPAGYNYQDPLGGNYNIPKTTITQTLSPTGQATFDANARTSLNLANTGEAASNRIGGILNTNFADTFARAPAAPESADVLGGAGAPVRSFDAGGAIQRSIYDPGQQQTTFGDAGSITRGYGPADNFSADRQRVEESLFQRMSPQLQQDRARLEQQLADQGLQPGTEAYDRAIDAANRQTTDARLGVTAAGGAEQQRMMDMAAQEAGFQNAAQKQAYEQAQGRGTFANQAQLEQYQKNLQSGNFANQAQKDAFTQNASQAQFYNAGTAQDLAWRSAMNNARGSDRDRWLTEQYALRSQPISEINALQSGAQVQQPSWAPTNNQQIANTDVAGIINKSFDQGMDIYKQNSTNVNNVIGGLFGLAGSAGKSAATAYASDRRVKKNIQRLGTVFAARRHDEPKKLPIYSYEYKGSDKPHVGPMAQDVEKIDPQAVTTRKGVKHIYPRKVMGDILRVA